MPPQLSYGIQWHTDKSPIFQGGVGVNEGVGESGWIVEKDKPEYDEIFNRLEISGGKVTGEKTGIRDKDID